MSRRVRAEVLAQALAERFEDQEGWEWNEVADWVVDTFLPLERRLGRLREILRLEGATHVTFEEPVDDVTRRLVEVLGMRLEKHRYKGRAEVVLVLDPT